MYIFDGEKDLIESLEPDDATQHLDDGGNFGWSLDMNSDGTLLAVGAPFQEGGGMVYIYRRTGQDWTEYGKVTGSAQGQGDNDEFGFDVALSDSSSDDPLLVVGARNARNGRGRAFLYSIPSGDTGTAEFEELFNPTVAGGLFGTSVAINSEGTRVVVGDPTANGEGKAHLYYYSDITKAWPLSQVVEPSSPADGTRFGYAVGVSTEVRAPSHDKSILFDYIRLTYIWLSQALLVGSTKDTAWSFVLEEVCDGSQPAQDKSRWIDRLPGILETALPASLTSEPTVPSEASYMTPTFSPTFTPTVNPTISDLPPLPRTRFLAWSLLSTDQMQIASDMGYAEDTWNLLGSSDVEHLTFYVLDNPQRKAAQSLGMTTEDIWDCHINHYHGYFWSDLVESSLDQYYSALGWTKANWEEGSRWPASESKYWESLSSDERSAAMQLCYTEEIWDEVPIPDWSLN